MLYGAYAQIVLLYALQYLFLASTVVLFLLTGFLAYVAPGLSSINTALMTKKAGGLVTGAVAAAANAAAAPATAAKDDTKKR